MLVEDRAAGARISVLLASQLGAKFYPTASYEQIGTLYLFTPKR